MQKSAYKIAFTTVLFLLMATAAFAGGEKEAPSDGQSMMMMSPDASRYVVYDEAAFDAAADQVRVYFFHAGWCPSCRSLDAEIDENLDRIPEEVVIFKTDYDSNRELKSRYGVTYQHTLVVVDAEGELVRKWNGGDFDTLLEELGML